MVNVEREGDERNSKDVKFEHSVTSSSKREGDDDNCIDVKLEHQLIYNSER